MKTTHLAHTVFLTCLFICNQPLQAADTTMLEQVTYEVQVWAPSGLMESRPDGTIESYPKDTQLALTLQGVLNGSNTTVTLTAKYTKIVDIVGIFHTADGLPLAYYPSGQVLPCFTKDSILPVKPTANTSSDTFLRAWLKKQFQDIRAAVRLLSEEASNSDPDAMESLGLILHPETRQQLLKLQSSSDPKVSAEAKKALTIWNKLRLAASQTQ